MNKETKIDVTPQEFSRFYMESYEAGYVGHNEYNTYHNPRFWVGELLMQAIVKNIRERQIGCLISPALVWNRQLRKWELLDL